MKGAELQIREMDPTECAQFLARNNLGRIAFARHSIVDIEPISYVHVDGWLFGRTSPGTKLDVLGHQPWVAFEADEVKGPFDWESVVVRGTFYLLHKEGSEIEQATYERALAALRRLMPAALTNEDPAPHRSLLFGIHIDSIAGRSAKSQ
jgi:hypothetical protein